MNNHRFFLTVLTLALVLLITNAAIACDISSPQEILAAAGGTRISGDTSGDIYDNVIIPAGKQATITGSLFGNMVVEKGATAIIKGSIMGNITSEGGTVKIYGSIMGDIKSKDTSISIYGKMTGKIVRKGGTLFIDKKATFIGSEEKE
jgi:hypothetical protein